MGSIHHLTRYIPNLAKRALTLESLLKNTDKHKALDWKSKHTSAFHNNLKLVSEITENKHVNQHLDTGIVCDASKFGLGAALEQNTDTGWVAEAYASRFLNSLEEKYSVYELELFGQSSISDTIFTGKNSL